MRTKAEEITHYQSEVLAKYENVDQHTKGQTSQIIIFHYIIIFFLGGGG